VSSEDIVDIVLSKIPTWTRGGVRGQMFRDKEQSTTKQGTTTDEF